MNPSRVFLNFARAAAFVVVALALFALGTWVIGSWHIATFGAGYVPMAPITATLFLLLGSAQLMTLLRPLNPCCRLARWILAGVTALIGLIVIVSRDRGLPWDNWFVIPGSRPENLPIGRMSLLAAVLFELAAASLMACSVRRPTVNRLTTIGAGAGLTIAALAGAGYAAGITSLYAPANAPIALLTVVAFLAFNLSLLLARLAQATDGSETLEIPAEGRVLGQRLLAGSLGGAVLIVSLGFLYIHSEQTEAREQVRGELEAVANLKAKEVLNWRAERLSEGTFLTKAPFVAEDVAQLVANPSSQAARDRVLSWLNLIRGGDRYASVTVFDAAGRVLLSTPEATANEPHEAVHVPGFLSGKEVVLTDLHMSELEPRPHLEMMVPIHAGSPSAGPIGHIVLELIAEQALFPMIQTWPRSSASAETLLVRLEGGDVLYLNQLRHAPNSALRMRRSLQDPGLVAATALRGNMEVKEGRDYRGVPVLTAVRPIPGTSWILVAKVDREEVYAPIRRQAWQVALMLALLLTLLATGTGVIWRTRQAGFLRHMVQAEQERKLLSERLALVTRYASDIIVLLDADGRVVDANERAIEAYGYTLEEMRRLEPGSWWVDAAPGAFQAQMARYNTEGVLYEAVHRRRDGTTFPVEISGRIIETDHKSFRLGIVRDITQRKESEQQIDRLTRLYAALSQINQTIVHSPTRKELLQKIAEVLVTSGRLRLVWIGWCNPQTGWVDIESAAGDDGGYLDGLRVSTEDRPEGQGPTGTSIRYNRTEVCNDFIADPRTGPWRERAVRAGIKASISLPLRRNGRAVGAITAYAGTVNFFGPSEIKLLEEAAEDLSFALEAQEKDRLRQDAEAALHASEARFRSLFETSIDAILLTDPDGRIYAVNPAACELIGGTEAEICAGGRREIIDATDERLAELLAQRQRTGRAAGEVRFRRRDGSTFEAEISSSTFQTPQGARSSIVVRDITARKQAEARLLEHMDELRRWHGVTLGREQRVMELKKEINELLEQAGQPPRYPTGRLATNGVVDSFMGGQGEGL